MGGTPKQKLKILYLMKILLERTDDVHSLSVDKIIAHLGEYGIGAERKSIYADIDALREYGFEIGVRRGRGVGYYIANRSFELPELRLLVNAVQSSHFITCRKSGELIKKLAGLTSVYEAIRLQRKVYINDMLKNHDETVSHNIDALHDAIIQNAKISFQHFDWTPDKTRILRNGGIPYVVNPWALTFDDKHYYLIAYQDGDGDIRNYRVDKMQNIVRLEQTREKRPSFESLDAAEHLWQGFGVFGGRAQSVLLSCDNSLAGVIIDRFGSEVEMQKEGEGFNVAVRVAVSPLFLAWVLGFGGKMIIKAPAEAIERIKELAASAIAGYSYYLK